MRSFLVGCILAGSLLAQSADPVEDGKALYRSNCAFCHGLTGGGGRGPALAQGNFVHGSTAAEIRRVIREGVPGTNMPAFRMAADELDHLVAFIQSFTGAGVKRPPVEGNALMGRAVYGRSGCAVVIAEQRHHFIRGRADDGDRADVARERQHTLVLQQHDGGLRGFTRESIVLG